MTARKELKQKAHQLTEMIHATYEALDAIALRDPHREHLRKQVDLRVAARKQVLKLLWVTPPHSGLTDRDNNDRTAEGNRKDRS